ncbi:uncharacterized protein DS421_3g83950 [Arachis hypogaea]|nr:uncharacterized protein DS421_3g83950 [Arachis hypogaea]
MPSRSNLFGRISGASSAHYLHLKHPSLTPFRSNNLSPKVAPQAPKLVPQMPPVVPVSRDFIRCQKWHLKRQPKEKNVNCLNLKAPSKSILKQARKQASSGASSAFSSSLKRQSSEVFLCVMQSVLQSEPHFLKKHGSLNFHAFFAL